MQKSRSWLCRKFLPGFGDGNLLGKESSREVNEEVVGILCKEASSGKGIQRIDLSGRLLRLLPERPNIHTPEKERERPCPREGLGQ
ncbi:unnamed protein product [Camellia sinensis]